MRFPRYVHSIIPTTDRRAWPVSAQEWNACDFSATANTLNLLAGAPQYTASPFIAEAGVLYQPRLGGTISPLKVWQLRRHGYGTHFGCLRHTAGEVVLRDLIDRRVPVIIELGAAFCVRGRPTYGRHSVVLVGYSEPYTNAQGQQQEDYYVVDSLWPIKGSFDLGSNDHDVDGDGVTEVFPGNRTLNRAEFQRLFVTGIYCPVFRTPEAHAHWYRTMISPRTPRSLLERLGEVFLFGSDDRLRAASQRREAPQC